MDAIKLLNSLNQRQLRERLCLVEAERSALIALIRAAMARDRSQTRREKKIIDRKGYKKVKIVERKK